MVDYYRRLSCRWLHNTTVAQNARQCRVLSLNTTILFLCSVFLVLHRDHEKPVSGRAFRIQPRVCADGVESPDALALLASTGCKGHQQTSHVRILYT